MRSVVVVGGGITGLAAAHALAGRGDDLEVTLVEGDARLGGKILTEHEDGITYEAGADAFVARDPAILQLCTDLRLHDDLIAPSVFGAHIWSGEKMKALPSDWAFGLPTDASSILSSELLPLNTKIRALWDLVAPGKLTGDDISVGDLVRRRLGEQLLERVVDPLLGGSRAGTADDISLAAGMPPLDAVARSSASLVRGLGKAQRAGELPEGPPPFLSLPGGMQRLVDSLTHSLPKVEVSTGTRAVSIEGGPGGYSIQLDDGAALDADAAILAVPAYSAGDLIDAINPEAARQLYRIQYASSAVAVLVYAGGQEKLPRTGSGFLVPSRDHRTLTACTWYSTKWPEAAPGDPRLVLRCFVGRTDREASLALDDDDLIGLIEGEVKEALELTDALQTWKLYRWDRGLPHYRVGHLSLLEKIDAAVATTPGIELAGAAYRGSGLPDCVRQGQQAAARALAFVATSDG